MSLPSQSPRAAATGRTHVRTHRRRGFRFPPLVIAGVIVVGGIAVAWFLTRGGDGDGSPLGPDAANAGETLLDDPYALDSNLRTDAGQQTTARPVVGRSQDEPPVTIDQGGGARPSTETGFDPARSLSIDQPRTLGESLAQSDPVRSEPVEGNKPVTPPPAPGAFERVIAAADQRIAANDPVAARSLLSDALRKERLTDAQRSQLRARLTELNQQLVFSATVAQGDPLVGTYEIVSGDALSRIPSKVGLAIDWRLLQRINAIPNANSIRLGQKIKVVRGPFHAVVDKSDYRLDIYTGPPDYPEQWTYIRSFRVGLGEQDSTPTGSFVVKRDSKLVNPHWVNPRTGERFDQNDPENPIGERWVGIEGLGEDAVKTGYGIHGTIDPGSIGQQKSMGCVRMLDTDVELVYELLVEGISRVRIQE